MAATIFFDNNSGAESLSQASTTIAVLMKQARDGQGPANAHLASTLQQCFNAIVGVVNARTALMAESATGAATTARSKRI